MISGGLVSHLGSSFVIVFSSPYTPQTPSFLCILLLVASPDFVSLIVMAPISELASVLVNEIPVLANRLRKYDEQNFQLQLRFENLEEEIARVRRSIAYKQAQQVRIVEQLAYQDVSAGSSKTNKRQRTEGSRSLAL
ncbi:hypothetical protein B0H10DRAFT_2220434 [Mycena sp. CBHHK59/15]|nr:hypothetical protein B0H10DRAFT_2220434 [Mycena sp. CBHHK59/15]